MADILPGLLEAAAAAGVRDERVKDMDMLKIVFPLLMVVGAAGSLVVNILDRGGWPTSLQWVGACLLYTALMFRNMG